MSIPDTGPWRLGRRTSRAAVVTLRLVFATLLVALLIGCVAPTRSQGLLIEEQVVDGVTIGLAAVDIPEVNSAFELVVNLADAQGAPIDGASVYIDLTMPAMPMGTNTPVAEPLGQGQYRAGNVVMDMAGEWELEVVAEIDGAEHRAVFTRTAVE
jgi:nitrogen fixation protein FixH